MLGLVVVDDDVVVDDVVVDGMQTHCWEKLREREREEWSNGGAAAASLENEEMSDEVNYYGEENEEVSE